MIDLPEEFPAGVFGLLVSGFLVLCRRQEVYDVVVSAHPAVDLDVQRDEHAVGETLMEGLDSCGVAVVIHERDRFVDQRDRGLIEHAVE